MNKEDCINQIIDIFKQSAINFRDDFNKNLSCYFSEEKEDEDIILHFYITYDRELEYLIIFKKQQSTFDYIPNIKNHNKLSLSSNPFKSLNFTDENVILSHIYDNIQKIKFDEIACYQNFGIILRNPLDLTGIYNINIKYITD